MWYHLRNWLYPQSHLETGCGEGGEEEVLSLVWILLNMDYTLVCRAQLLFVCGASGRLGTLQFLRATGGDAELHGRQVHRSQLRLAGKWGIYPASEPSQPHFCTAFSNALSYNNTDDHSVYSELLKIQKPENVCS